MTKQTLAFKRAVDALVATLPEDWYGRVAINVGANGNVVAELSEFVKIGSRKGTKHSRSA